MKLPLILLFSLTLAFSDGKVEEKTQTRLESLTKLTEVISTIEKYYVEDIKLQQIVDKSLKGLLKELDAHSSFMDSKSFKQMKVQTEGEFGGLGITVGMRDGALTVISPIDDTPAYKAGVKSGDIILKIDDKSTLDMTLEEAVSLMRGKPKTPIELTLVRDGENKPLKIEIIRDIITIDSVHAKVINKRLLYLRITSFDRKVVKDLQKYITQYQKSTDGIVLDLRNNPGGLLDQAIGVVDLFVDEGVIVSQKGRVQSDDNFYAKSSNTLSHKPLVVLVNGGSASASEIVSGSLQDHKRAVVVGEKTFGKGSVQVVLPIKNSENEGIKLTVAKYYLPAGRTIQAKGVEPDIVSYPGKDSKKDENEFEIKEADLKKHLQGELQEKSNTSKKSQSDQSQGAQNSKDIITKKQVLEDNQLKTAVDVLQALIIIN